MWFALNKHRLKIVKDTIKNILFRRDLYYLVENAKWSVEHDGCSITSNLQTITASVTTTHHAIRKRIIHFGSINTFLTSNCPILPHNSNKIIVTWFHVSPGDNRVNLIPKVLNKVHLWHCSCNITKDKLISLGVPQEKIIVIPLGVNLKAFSVSSNLEKQFIRFNLGIPQDKIIIGSFQKDGNGWGEGLKPKYIKGPDIFCDAIEKLRQHYDLFVVLTGPARGYVKQRLERSGIPYLHRFLNNPDEVAQYYKVLDIYIVAGRVEGGPKSILESLASGVPIVSTKVGMAADIIKDGVNGCLCDIENVDQIVKRTIEIIENQQLREKLIKEGLNIIHNYDWSNIAAQYEQLLYKPLL